MADNENEVTGEDTGQDGAGVQLSEAAEDSVASESNGAGNGAGNGGGDDGGIGGSDEGEPARYGVCADFTVKTGDRRWEEEETQVVDGLAGASRRDITVTLTLPVVSEDSWIMAIAHGTDGESPPMFPVVPEDLDRASNQTLEDLTDDNLDEAGILAYAFTNPLFLDVGANGWEPPGVANAACSE